MTGFNWKTDTDAMSAAVNAINAALADLTNYLSRLQASLSANISGWTGQASAQYVTLQDQWNTDQQKMNAALDDLNNALRTAMTNYQNAEQANTQTMTPH